MSASLVTTLLYGGIVCGLTVAVVLAVLPERSWFYFAVAFVSLVGHVSVFAYREGRNGTEARVGGEGVGWNDVNTVTFVVLVVFVGLYLNLLLTLTTVLAVRTASMVGGWVALGIAAYAAVVENYLFRNEHWSLGLLLFYGFVSLLATVASVKIHLSQIPLFGWNRPPDGPVG